MKATLCLQPMRYARDALIGTQYNYANEHGAETPKAAIRASCSLPLLLLPLLSSLGALLSLLVPHKLASSTAVLAKITCVFVCVCVSCLKDDVQNHCPSCLSFSPSALVTLTAVRCSSSSSSSSIE